MTEGQKLFVSKILALSLLIVAAVLSLNDVMPSKGEGGVRTYKRRIDSVRASSKFQKRNTRSKREPIPRIIHQAMLGRHPPEYMEKFVQYTEKRALPMDFLVMDWRDADADRLVFDEDTKGEIPGLLQAWEYIKSDTGSRRYAKMADFLRVLIMYSIGGIYLDVDVVFCHDIEFFLDDPGVASFPAHVEGNGEVNGNMMSAPPGHLLMKHALEYFVNEGEELKTRGNMLAAGPLIFGKATDEYFFSRGIDIPPLVEKSYNDNEEVPGKIKKPRHGYYELQIADVRFGHNIKKLEMYHLEFRSWQDDKEREADCIEHPEKIIPYLDSFCAAKKEDRHAESEAFTHECGIEKRGGPGKYMYT